MDGWKWRDDLLRSRSLTYPDHRYLYAYRLNSEEYDNLRLCMVDAVSKSSGGIHPLSLAMERPWFPALFVLFASEWWRRNYDGTGFSWEPILRSFGGDPSSWTAIQRQGCVEEGIDYWGLYFHQSTGMRYIGEIAFQGGLPLRLLRDAHGSLSRVLESVLEESSRIAIEESDLVTWIRSLSRYLPQTYRQDELYQLLAKMIWTLLALGKQANLASEKNILEALDRDSPSWRDLFPLPLDDRDAQQLLERLVLKSVNVRIKPPLRTLTVVRWLETTGDEVFELHSKCEFPEWLTEEQVRDMFGVGQLELPMFLQLELVLGDARYSIHLRRLAGQDRFLVDQYPIELNPLFADREHLLVLNTGDGRTWPALLKGGISLDDDLPWIFEGVPSEQMVLLGTGSTSTKLPSTVVSIPEGWEVAQSERWQPIGTLIVDGRVRPLVLIQGNARIENGASYCQLRTGVLGEAQSEIEWIGKRLRHLEGGTTPIFLGMPRPSEVSLQNGRSALIGRAGWRISGQGPRGEETISSGPLELFYPRSGALRRRLRALVLPEGSSFESEGRSITEGTVTFKGWKAIAADVLTPGVVSKVARDGDTLTVALQQDASANMSPLVLLALYWSHTNEPVRVSVPFPSKGLKVVLSDDSVVMDQGVLSVKQLLGSYLEFSVGDPKKVPRLQLELSLAGHLYARTLRLYPNLDRPYLEISADAFIRDIARLLALGNDADVSVTLQVRMPDKLLGTLTIRQFDSEILYTAPDVTIATAHLDSPVDAVVQPDFLYGLRLASPASSPVELESRLNSHRSWSADPLLDRPGPWIIYTSKDSRRSPRPLLMPVHGGAEPSDGLAAALSREHQYQRLIHLETVLEQLSSDFLSDEWGGVESVWRSLGHLPLSTFDIWRAATRSESTMASFAVREWNGMTVNDLERFGVELPFHWEFVGRSAWASAISLLRAQMKSQYGDLGDLIFNEFLEARMSQLSQRVPSLTRLLHFARVEAQDETHARDLLVLRLRQGDEYFAELVEGSDSPLQKLYHRQSFRHGAPVQWPMTLNDFVNRYASSDIVQRYFWRDQQPYRQSVINLPIVLAVLAWEKNRESLFGDADLNNEIQRYKDFDVEWFVDAFNAMTTVLGVRSDWP